MPSCGHLNGNTETGCAVWLSDRGFCMEAPNVSQLLTAFCDSPCVTNCPDSSARKSSVILDLFKQSLFLTPKHIPHKITVPRLQCMGFNDSIVRGTDRGPLTSQKQMRFKPPPCHLLPGSVTLGLSRDPPETPFPWV